MSHFAQATSDDDSVVYFLQGGREMVDKTRAEELVAQIPQVEGKNFTHIDLSNKSFSDEAAIVIGADLKKRCGQVRVAHLADMIAGRKEEEALRTLKSICDGLEGVQLDSLNLDDNAMGKPGVVACEAVLKCKSLKKLSLCNDGLSGEAGEKLFEILSTGGMPALEVFQFYNNMAGDPGAVAVSKIISLTPKLTEFRFSGTRSQKDGCDEVAKALLALSEGGTRFKKLDLSDNIFSSPRILDLLKQQNTLTSLNLRDSSLDALDAFNSLNEIFREAAPPLKFLDLSGNDFGMYEGCSELYYDVFSAPCLVQNVVDLALDDNMCESTGAVGLAKALRKYKALATLSVNCCEITAKGAVALCRAVGAVSSFVCLRMDGNLICEEGLEQIEGIMLIRKKKLEAMEDNDDDGEDDLAELGEEDEEEEEDDEEEVDKIVDDQDVDEMDALMSAAKIASLEVGAELSLS